MRLPTVLAPDSPFRPQTTDRGRRGRIRSETPRPDPSALSFLCPGLISLSLQRSFAGGKCEEGGRGLRALPGLEAGRKWAVGAALTLRPAPGRAGPRGPGRRGR